MPSAVVWRSKQGSVAPPGSPWAQAWLSLQVLAWAAVSAMSVASPMLAEMQSVAE